MLQENVIHTVPFRVSVGLLVINISIDQINQAGKPISG